jgi:hypothetical protein
MNRKLPASFGGIAPWIALQLLGKSCCESWEYLKRTGKTNSEIGFLSIASQTVMIPFTAKRDEMSVVRSEGNVGNDRVAVRPERQIPVYFVSAGIDDAYATTITSIGKPLSIAGGGKRKSIKTRLGRDQLAARHVPNGLVVVVDSLAIGRQREGAYQTRTKRLRQRWPGVDGATQ